MRADPLLPVGPFREWVRRELETVDRETLAARLGVGARSVKRWEQANVFVPLSVVDSALCASGEPGLLNELYPLDDEGDVGVAA